MTEILLEIAPVHAIEIKGKCYVQNYLYYYLETMCCNYILIIQVNI